MKHCPHVLCLFALASCAFPYPRTWVERTDRFEFEPATVQRIDCDTHNGSIESRVDPANPKIVVVAAIRAGGADELDAQHALDAVVVRCAVDAGTLAADWAWRIEDSAWDADVSFAIELPAALPIAATTHNGNIQVVARGECTAETHNGAIDVSGDVEHVVAESHNGRIQVRGPVQVLDATTHNGAVRIEPTTAGRVDAHVVTHNGGIALVLADEVDAIVDASTSNGDIESAGRLSEVSVRDGRLKARAGAGTGKIELQTHNGSITVSGPGVDSSR